MKIYTGVGSRETPHDIGNLFYKLAISFARAGYTLRSGHSGVADLSFEAGCDHSQGKKEIYIPWHGFNQSDSQLYTIPKEAYAIAEKYHPAFQYQTQGTQKLLARDVLQVLGQDLNTPSDVIICWTPDGEIVGGTAMALQVGMDAGVKILNRGQYPDDANFIMALRAILGL